MGCRQRCSRLCCGSPARPKRRHAVSLRSPVIRALHPRWPPCSTNLRARGRCPDLARLCNMSRATLVRQFQEKLGRSPSDLLTDIRMTLAANELKRSSLSAGAVAEAVGNQSEAAVPRTFTGHMGVTPAQGREMQEPPVPDVFGRPPVPSDA